jgi:hypothetical protein
VGSWFAAQKNFEFIVNKKHVIAAFRDNRLAALSCKNERQEHFSRMSLCARPVT